jgi:flavin-dependent dehydrogenase
MSTVCVIGGGPAGSTFAARLAALGHEVLLIERQAFPRRHLGESLSPGVLPLLEMTGARRLAGAEASPVRAVRVKWGGDVEVREDPRAQGAVVDRGAFDRSLLGQACALGVRVLQPALVRACRKVDAGWRLAVEVGGRTVAIEADFLADARGRAAPDADSRQRTGCRTLALYAYWEGADLPRQPRIEAGEEAWYWGVPLPDGTYNTLVFVDPKRFREAPAATTLAERFLGLLERSGLLAGHGTARMLGRVSAIDATPYIDRHCASPTMIKIGDAALAIDPLSSSGVQKAIQGALSAAIVANTLLRRPDGADTALGFYRMSLTDASDRHCRWAAAYYARVAGQGGGPFWQDRSAGPKEVEPPPGKPVDTAAFSALRVGLSRDLELIDTACIEGEFVTMKRALRHPGLETPVAFLAGQELAPLLHRLPSCATPLEIARSWSAKMPLECGLAIAGWMLSRGILVGHEAGGAVSGHDNAVVGVS